ncbi:MAG TPA: FAD/NAD(P)-binding oxidoreductase [Paenirhodobacter sp.]
MTAKIIIVGAGPAGIRAAESLVAAGLSPTVIDEGARAGGQIYRRPPEGFTRPASTLYGSEAVKAQTLHQTFDAMADTGRLRHLPRSSVMAMANGQVHVLGPEGSQALPYDRLILATGASDRVAPVPGWQSAGVYTLGAAQIALKAQGVALGRRLVLLGSGPLLTLVAVQLRKAGADVAAVLDTAGPAQQLRGTAGLMARPVVAARGVWMRAKLRGIYHAGVTPKRIETDTDGPVAVIWRDRYGARHRTPCDAVAMGWHLRAETHMADLAGVPFDYNDLWAQWLPRSDRMGRAGNGIYLAGDGLRLLGADGAEITGRLAAQACLQDLGLQPDDAGQDLRQLARLERFAHGLARAFPWPRDIVRTLPPDAVVCRCEGITAATLCETVEYGGAEANRVKSLARVGMGRCQGRYCQLAAAELIAAQTGGTAAAAGRLRAQAPARPAPIDAILQCPSE